MGFFAGCLVLSREWGNGLWRLLFGDHIESAMWGFCFFEGLGLKESKWFRVWGEGVGYGGSGYFRGLGIFRGLGFGRRVEGVDHKLSSRGTVGL